MSLDISLYQDVDLGGPSGPERLTLFDISTTHNLSAMWEFVGVHEILYKSDGELAGKYAETLASGVSFMERHGDTCRQYDAPNFWGTYKQALPWLREVAAAFRKYPNATIRVSK
jgi:hypothetical protein